MSTSFLTWSITSIFFFIFVHSKLQITNDNDWIWTTDMLPEAATQPTVPQPNFDMEYHVVRSI